MSLLKCVARGM